jgi:hypothetical protein
VAFLLRALILFSTVSSLPGFSSISLKSIFSCCSCGSCGSCGYCSDLIDSIDAITLCDSGISNVVCDPFTTTSFVGTTKKLLV